MPGTPVKKASGQAQHGCNKVVSSHKEKYKNISGGSLHLFKNSS